MSKTRFRRSTGMKMEFKNILLLSCLFLSSCAIPDSSLREAPLRGEVRNPRGFWPIVGGTMFAPIGRDDYVLGFRRIEEPMVLRPDEEQNIPFFNNRDGVLIRWAGRDAAHRRVPPVEVVFGNRRWVLGRDGMWTLSPGGNFLAVLGGEKEKTLSVWRLGSEGSAESAEAKVEEARKIILDDAGRVVVVGKGGFSFFLFEKSGRLSPVSVTDIFSQSLQARSLESSVVTSQFEGDKLGIIFGEPRRGGGMNLFEAWWTGSRKIRCVPLYARLRDTYKDLLCFVRNGLVAVKKNGDLAMIRFE